SDTEVLLNMYIEFGRKSLDYLNGMFAFAVYDSSESSLFLARDHFGIKPIYYYSDSECLIFASEIKALLQHPRIKAQADWNSINEYLVLQMVLGKETLFKNIHKLEPATYMTAVNGRIKEERRYWDLQYQVDDEKSMDRFSDELLVLLESSLSIQMRSDVPVGAYLSGGLDSSIVATLAAKTYPGSLKTFTGGFKDSAQYDETLYASVVSQSIGSEHHEIFPTYHDFLENFESLVYFMDEPVAGPGMFPQYMVSKLASKHVKVVLGGQGGDEIFGGYARYAVAYLEQCLKGAILETQEEENHVVTLNSILPNMPMLKQYLPMIRSQFNSGLFDPMDKRYFQLVNRSHQLREILSPALLGRISAEPVFEKFSSVFNHPGTKSYFNKMTYYDLKTLLPALLHVEDRMSMAVSIESRVPLLDKRIVEMAGKIPPTMKFAGGKTKQMLLHSVRNILPKEIIQRKDKMGFPTPLNEWLAGPLKEYALDTLTGKTARERGLWNTIKIEENIRKSERFSRDLWGALNMEVWFRKFAV
ncbi:MAG TPA: asparagine synthase (glutamine-hydrolyzing), partial [Leptospiraceae bacterium]|nr:asparagine synthase (glutamine-hydrolyzing) [Leptospiraceae bacterium]